MNVSNFEELQAYADSDGQDTAVLHVAKRDLRLARSIKTPRQRFVEGERLARPNKREF